MPFLATYAAIIGLNLLGPVLFSFLDIPRPPARHAGAAASRSLDELVRRAADRGGDDLRHGVLCVEIW